MPIQTVSQAFTNEGVGGFSFRNKFINGDMRVNQRATDYSGIITNGQYMTDRWSIEFGGLSNCTYNAAHSTDAPSGFAHSLSVSVAAASTAEGSTSYFVIRQGFEVQNLDDFGWGTSGAKPVTISFWVKNSTTNPFSAGVRCAVNGGTFAFFKSFTVNAINTWEKKTFTITAPTQFASGFTGSRNGYALDFHVGLWTSVGGAFATDGQWSTGNLLGTANSNTFVRTVGANIKVTGFQMEVGSIASPFESRPYGTELALCQRYFYKLGGTGSTTRIGLGHYEDSTAVRGNIPFPVTMRAIPTGTTSGNLRFYTTAPRTYTPSLEIDSAQMGTWTGTTTTSGTAGQAGFIDTSGFTSSFIQFSADI